MRYSHDPEAHRLIRVSREAIAATRHMIARNARERETIQVMTRETRRLIEVARADRARREG